MGQSGSAATRGVVAEVNREIRGVRDRMKELGDHPSLEAAQDYWANLIQDEGGVCPCCGRFGKIYKRTINANMARGLIWLVFEWEKINTEWVDVPEKAPRWLVKSNQLPTLRWWGLVERLESSDPSEKFSGFWRPTTRGLEFAKNRLAVHQAVFTYAGDPVNFEGPMVLISQCGGKKFDYSKVMEETYR
jgi:hypothetical protein